MDDYIRKEEETVDKQWRPQQDLQKGTNETKGEKVDRIRQGNARATWEDVQGSHTNLENSWWLGCSSLLSVILTPDA